MEIIGGAVAIEYTTGAELFEYLQRVDVRKSSDVSQLTTDGMNQTYPYMTHFIAPLATMSDLCVLNIALMPQGYR